MKFPLRCVVWLFFAAAPLFAQQAMWQTLTNPSAAEVAGHFRVPPPEYSSQVTWGWAGVMTREVIARDLDHLLALNLHQAWVEPGRNPEAPYLSPAYFENVKIAVEEAKKRHMYLWFDDDGGYPSGFAGGKFTAERPELRMKGLATPEQVEVPSGQVFARPAEDNLICAVAVRLDGGANQLIEPKGGNVTWTAPATGRWAVVLVKWVYRSGVTRSANNKSGAKDNEHSLMDYLSPEANRLFIAWTFEQYKQAVGDEFGRTFLGFRGDEAAYGFKPWTPDFPAEFQRRKGYDIRPYLPAVAAIQIGRTRGNPTPPPVTFDAAHRAFADYCDVWSDLFGANFFSADAKWCAVHQLALQHHIEHEEILPQLAIANGDFFKCMRDVQVPGVDVIWHQLWHDVVADFPKLASSAAHLNGRPHSMSESFAAMSGNYPTPDIDEVGWILNHQIALGITHFEYMFMRASTTSGGRPGGFPPGGRAKSDAPPATGRGVAPPGYRYLNDPKFPALAQAVNRATYVLAQGRPTAQIGVFIPSSSFWFADGAKDRSFRAIVHALLEHQRDVDFIDDYSLAHALRLERGELVNGSGQPYRAIVVPPADAISRPALNKLEAFARAGGKVVFLGGPPALIPDQNFLTASAPGRLDWARIEALTEITPELLAALPPPDVAVDRAAPGLKYNHRQIKDADVYFLFNEGEAALDVTVTLQAAKAQRVEIWDAQTGDISPLTSATLAAQTVTLPLNLPSWATQLVVIRRS